MCMPFDDVDPDYYAPQVVDTNERNGENDNENDNQKLQSMNDSQQKHFHKFDKLFMFTIDNYTISWKPNINPNTNQSNYWSELKNYLSKQFNRNPKLYNNQSWVLESDHTKTLNKTTIQSYLNSTNQAEFKFVLSSMGYAQQQYNHEQKSAQSSNSSMGYAQHQHNHEQKFAQSSNPSMGYGHEQHQQQQQYNQQNLHYPTHNSQSNDFSQYNDNQNNAESEKETMTLLEHIRCERYYQKFINRGADILCLITFDDNAIKDVINEIVKKPLHVKIILNRVLQFKKDYNKMNGQNKTKQKHVVHNAEEPFGDDDIKQQEMVQHNAPQYNSQNNFNCNSQPSNSNLHYPSLNANNTNQNLVEQVPLKNPNIKWYCLVEDEISGNFFWAKYPESEQNKIENQWKQFCQSGGNDKFKRVDVKINDYEKRRILFNKSGPAPATQVSPNGLKRTVIRAQPDNKGQINGISIADDNGNPPPFVQNTQNHQNHQNHQNQQHQEHQQHQQHQEHQEHQENVSIVSHNNVKKPTGWCWWCNKNEKWIPYSDLNHSSINDKWDRFKQSQGIDFFNKVDVKENGCDMRIEFKKAQIYTLQPQATGTRFNPHENRVEDFEVAFF